MIGPGNQEISCHWSRLYCLRTNQGLDFSHLNQRGSLYYNRHPKNMYYKYFNSLKGSTESNGSSRKGLIIHNFKQFKIDNYTQSCHLKRLKSSKIFKN